MTALAIVFATAALLAHTVYQLRVSFDWCRLARYLPRMSEVAGSSGSGSALAMVTGSFPSNDDYHQQVSMFETAV